MPNYAFLCKKCGNKWEDYCLYNDRNNQECPKCKEIGQLDYSKWSVFKVWKGKYLESGKDRIDQGIPFGEVPGDEEYMNGDLNDPDYIGPLP